MSRRARNRALAIEAKRSTFFIGLEPDEDDQGEDDQGEGNAPNVEAEVLTLPGDQR